MDPDVTLENARAACTELCEDTENTSAAEKFIVAFEALDEWLSKGGFLSDTRHLSLIPASEVQDFLLELRSDITEEA